MPTTNFETFQDKYGFEDGGACGDLDFAARSILVKKLNAGLRQIGSNITAVEYDRGGMHNPCFILTIKDYQPGDEDKDEKPMFEPLPDELWTEDLYEDSMLLLGQCYDIAAEVLAARRRLDRAKTPEDKRKRAMTIIEELKQDNWLDVLEELKPELEEAIQPPSKE